MAVYLLNLTGTSSVSNKTLYELWTGKSVTVDHLRSFGQSVFVHVPNENRKKLAAKAEKCVFVGYGVDKQGFRCFNERTRAVTTARNVTFVEEQQINLLLTNEEKDIEEVHVPAATEAGKKMYWCDVSQSNIIENRLRKRNSESSEEEFQSADEPRTVALAAMIDREPRSVTEAMQSDEKWHWEAAMKEEFDSLIQNETWTLVERGDHKVLDNKWVFKRKLDPMGNVVRHKARLVARGFNQQF